MTNWRDYIFFEDERITVLVGDTREILPLLPKELCQSAITSPPYFGLRNYSTATWEGGDVDCDHKRDEAFSDAGEEGKCVECGALRVDQQIGLEATPAEFTAAMVDVFDKARRTLKKDATVWVNLGDSYNGSGKGGNPEDSPHTKQKTNVGSLIGTPTRVNGYKNKDLMLIPHTVAMALRDAGWWLRQAFPWVKASAMPESVTDRAANALEYIFHLSIGSKYFYDAEAIRKGMTVSSVQRLSQNIEDQAGSVRANGGAKTNGTMKAVGGPAHWKGSSFEKGKTGQHQLNRAQKDRDRSLPTNRNGITGSLDEAPGGSRNFRNADLWYESVQKPHGVTFVGDQIVGIDCNPAGFSAEYCTACGRYYHDAKDKKEIEVTKVGDKDIRACICGATDRWLSHFATFPERLIIPFIKCSTSEAGECSECGKAWVRVVEKGLTAHDGTTATAYSEGMAANRIALLRQAARERGSEYANGNKTLGFAPQCECDAGAVPQTILDPFSGAGTTMISAAKLGRKCVAIELNESYAAMAVERYKREMNAPVDPPRRLSTMPLFDLEAGA